jgi:ABC-2 type transport system ATP-binding protein
MDEPTTGLDPQSRRALWDVVAALKTRGKTVVLTTHYMDEAERLCDRIAIVDHGKIIAQGTPASLIDDIGGHHFLELASSRPLPASAFEGLPGVRGHRAGSDSGQGLSLALEEPHTALPAILALLARHGAEPTRLVSRTATLDDVFLSLTGRNLREE